MALVQMRPAMSTLRVYPPEVAAECDHLIVPRIVSPQEAEVVYDGKGKLAWDIAGPMQKNGQRTINLKKLVQRGTEQV